VDRAIAETEGSGVCWFAAECHSVRGEILLKHDRVNTAPAEEAFLTAIAVAQQQNAKSFDVRSATRVAVIDH
jgi:hypothetical protein